MRIQWVRKAWPVSWVLGAVVCLAQSANAQVAASPADGVIVMRSDADFATTLARVEPAVKARGLFVMRVLDHSAAAAQFGRDLPPNTVVLFGNPQIGSQLMACAPRAGIDLPQKLILWESEGSVMIAYNDPAYLVRRHSITGCEEVVAVMSEHLRVISKQVSAGR